MQNSKKINKLTDRVKKEFSNSSLRDNVLKHASKYIKKSKCSIENAILKGIKNIYLDKSSLIKLTKINKKNIANFIKDDMLILCVYLGLSKKDIDKMSDFEILKKIDIEEIKMDIATNLAEEILYSRYTKEELLLLLNQSFGNNNELNEVDESGLICDYQFIYGINKAWGYMDIYYLKVPHGDKTIHITEVSVCDG